MHFLGTITIPTVAVRDNTTTAVPFVIPAGTRKLHLQCDGVVFVAFIAAGGGALLAANGRKMAAADATIDLDWNGRESQAILAVRNDTGGTLNVKVFRLS